MKASESELEELLLSDNGEATFAIPAPLSGFDEGIRRKTSSIRWIESLFKGFTEGDSAVVALRHELEGLPEE